MFIYIWLLILTLFVLLLWFVCIKNKEENINQQILNINKENKKIDAVTYLKQNKDLFIKK